MANKGVRGRYGNDVGYGEPDDEIHLPQIFAPGREESFRARRLNVPGSQWDFLTGAVDDNPAGPNPLLIPVGEQQQQQQQPAQHGFSGGPSGGLPRPQGRGPVNPMDFFGGEGGLDVNEYLAGKRGKTFQDIQGWNPATDGGFRNSLEVQAKIGDLASHYGVNMLNPLVRARLEREALNDASTQRAYQRNVLGYDPRYNKMLYPAGFDPATDTDFLQASAAEGVRKQTLREQALGAFYGPDYARRQREARIAQMMQFLGAA